MQVSQLGETELISRIQQTIEEAGVAGRPEEVPIGIGDDAALLRAGEGYLILTTDHAVENVHFLAEHVSARVVGRRAMAANVSDIAAMGGRPRYAVVSLALPPETEVDWVVELYQGMAERCRQSDIALVGGDLSTGPVRIVEITLVGAPTRLADSGEPCVLRRDTARTGDRVAVTGSLGGPAGGMRLLYGGSPAPEHQDLLNAFLHPPVRVEEAQILLALGVRTAMDISDGLATDLSKLCAASGLAARVQESAIPRHPRLDAAFPDEAVDLALGGGEDYELLFTCPADVLARAHTTLSCPVTEVGEIVDGPSGQVTILDASGQERPLMHTGWAHF